MVKKPFRVGLTGNIGSGKTAVAQLFSQLKVNVIDADDIARAIVEEKEIKKKLVQHFSNTILWPNQSLNRKKLLHLILDDLKDKKWLEHYLHPLIFERMMQQIKQVTSLYVIVVVPLLFEGQYQTYFDRTCLVIAEDTLKIKRISQRDDMSDVLAHRLLNTQIPTLEAIALADDVITNNGTIKSLKDKVKALHLMYEKLARLSKND
jgi:dephospho-CoA kinase